MVLLMKETNSVPRLRIKGNQKRLSREMALLLNVGFIIFQVWQGQ